MSSVHPQTYVSKQVSEVLSRHAASRGPETPSATTVQNDVRDIAKSDHDAGSQIATAQPEMNIATSKPSNISSVDQNWLPLTNGGISSGAFKHRSLRTHKSSICQVKKQTLPQMQEMTTSSDLAFQKWS